VERARVLIVDDAPEELLGYLAMLEELGAEIVGAHGGAEALERAAREDFAVILLDAEMPGMDGLETAAHIRRETHMRRTPIILLTASAGEMQSARAYELGVVDYVLRPIVPGVLRAKVRVFINLNRAHAELARSH